MTLTLAIRGCELLDNGAPANFRLDRHGAIIGRSAHADWSLPDPKNHISARHCEIGYREGRYLLTDRSTNGTFVNGSSERLASPYPIADGDRIQIGPYEVVAATDAGDARVADGRWDDDDQPVGEAPAGWDPPSAAMRRAAARGAAPVPLPFTNGQWDMPAPVEAPSAWSSDAREPQPPSAAQIWGELARAGEGIAASSVVLPETGEGAWDDIRPARPTSVAVPEPDPAPSAVRPVIAAPDEAAAVAVLRRMVAGTVRLVEARARAKAELAMASTTIELDGNNPLKFIRSPDRALDALLAPPQPGFMSAERAVDDAFADVETHELATITAMRAALERTVRSLSPDLVRERAAPAASGLKRFLPPLLNDALLWRRYVRDFEGMAGGADEGFMDRFERYFRVEYGRAHKAAAMSSAEA